MVYLKLLSFILENKKLIKPIFIVVGVLAILFILFTMYSRHMKKELEIVKNNYESELQGTVVEYRNKLETWMGTSRTQIHKFRKVHDKDKGVIDSLLILNKSLNNSIRKTVELLEYEYKIDLDLITNTSIDTVYLREPTFRQVLVERDSITIQTLFISRIKYSHEPFARYSIEYNPKIATFVNEKKEGKWKFKNIFKRRPRYYDVSVISNDSILKPVSVRHYINKKYK